MRIPKAKPCPFCRSTSGFVERMDLSTWQYVCNDCFAHGPDVCHGDWEEDKGEAEATRAWNKRKRASSVASQQDQGIQIARPERGNKGAPPAQADERSNGMQGRLPRDALVASNVSGTPE